MHSLQNCRADNFDMTTGELLTLADLIAEESFPVLNRLVMQRLWEQNEYFQKFAEEATLVGEDSLFRITGEGIEFIFQEYEIAPFAYGIVYVTVSYEDLQPILLL